MRGEVAFVALCTAMIIASCSDAGAPTTSVPGGTSTSTVDAIVETTTTSSISVTTSTPSSTASTATQPVFAPPDPFTAPEPSPTGGGSGCSPGQGSLPDGVWFGFLDGITDTTIEFDLACYLSCDPGDGFEIGNQSSRIRTLGIDRDAMVIFESVNGPDWQNTFEAVTSYEHIGLHNKVWVYVNDSKVTQIVLPADVRGCRYTEVGVQWAPPLPRAGLVAFNDLGVIASLTFGVGRNLFYWQSDNWQSADELAGVPHSGTEGSVVAAATNKVAIGAHMHRWTGSTWSTDVIDTAPGTPRALAISGDRALMAATSDDDTVVHVLTWSGESWSVETIVVGYSGHWVTVSGAISGDTFVIADTGIDSAMRTGVVRVFTWDGSSWIETATLHDEWDSGNWGSSLDLDGDQLLVGADGATPGPGSPGGLYLYTRTGDTWTPEIVGEGGEGFGFSGRIDGDTIIAAAAHSDETATFWVFVRAADGWRGTPIAIAMQDPFDDWVNSVDIRGSEVVVSTHDSLWIGVLHR